MCNINIVLSNDRFYDLYLYIHPNRDELIKIPHLNGDDARRYAKYWFDMNELHESMIVTENSTPWSNPEPTIEVKTPAWLCLEYTTMKKR